MSDAGRLREHRVMIEGLFEALAPIAAFEPLGDGWTCDTYRVNGDWIVQLPRTERAAQRLRAQMDVLPELAREVSAAVPVPELISHEPAAMAYRRIDGVAASGGEGIWPERLGRFLYDLHVVPPEFVGMRARGSDDVRAALGSQLEDFRVRVFPLLTAAERDASGERFRTFLEEERNWRFSPCVAHNDIGRAHVLVTETGDLAGVIDWEEVGIGDPSADLAWILGEEPEIGERTLAAYGGASDEGFRERCRFRFALAPWHDVRFGLDADRPEIVEAGLVALRELAAG
jgi:aminoglycoside phosphotransferase (APT) family kinase protein